MLFSRFIKHARTTFVIYPLLAKRSVKRCLLQPTNAVTTSTQVTQVYGFRAEA